MKPDTPSRADLDAIARLCDENWDHYYTRAKLRSDPGIKLVVSDVNMPNMDGLTMVEKIRGELKNNSVNVIMLTTESSPTMKERGKAAGIKGWIVKPFKGDAVLATFKKLVTG